jgi:hypothetical protein
MKGGDRLSQFIILNLSFLKPDPPKSPLVRGTLNAIPIVPILLSWSGSPLPRGLGGSRVKVYARVLEVELTIRKPKKSLRYARESLLR